MTESTIQDERYFSTTTSDELVTGGRRLEGHAAERYQAFHWYCGSVFLTLFSAAFVDQSMQADVSNATWASGRYEREPYQRTQRTMAAGQLMMWGDPSTNARELDRLKRLHQEVHGTSPNGARYSAFNPAAWNLVYLSIFFMYRNAYTPITGDPLTAEDDEIFYQMVWDKMGALSLSGKQSGLPRTYSAAVDYYDELIRSELSDTYMLTYGRQLLCSPPPPDNLPVVLRPLWRPLTMAAREVLITCGMGISRPEVQRLFGFTPTSRHRAEFAVICRVLPLLYRLLPKRMLLTPLAYNRWRYTRLVDKFESMQLDSFRVDAGR